MKSISRISASYNEAIILVLFFVKFVVVFASTGFIYSVFRSFSTEPGVWLLIITKLA